MPTPENWEYDYRTAKARNADPTILDDIYRNYQASGGTKSAADILAAQQQPAQPAQQPAQQPAFSHITAPDTSGIRTTLDQWLSNAQKQSGARIDETVRQSVNELARTQEDADAAYDRQRDQVNIEEARARDNQALYNAARGDRGGIGAAQYDSVMNTAALNRQAIRTEQNRLRTDILRQISDIRAQGDFQKEQSALEAANQYLSQLYALEQLELTNQLTVEQFNAQVDQARAAYELQLRQLEIASEQFNRQFAYQQERDAVADSQWQQGFQYQQSRDAVADSQWNQSFQYQQNRDAVADSQWQQGFQYQQSRDAVADARYADETAYNRSVYADQTAYNRGIYADETAYNRAQTERGNAYTLAMTALNAGFLPDTDTLTAAGISPEYAKQYKEYAEAQAALKAASTLDSSGAGQSVYDWLRTQGATDYGTAYELLQRNKFNSTDANRYAKYYAETWLPANPAPTSAAAQNVAKIAAKEVGYMEGRIGRTTNYTKYGEWMDADGQPWCASFVAWVFDQAGMGNLLPAKTASTTDFVNAAKKSGQWVTANYQEGDVVCFDYDTSDGKFDHMGIVKSVNADGTLTTIEGNHGNAVREVVRKPSKVAGAFRPKYPAEVQAANTAQTANTSAPAPTSAYGTNYNSIWKNCREMFDGARNDTRNMTLDQRRAYIMNYLDQQNETSLTDAGLRMIMNSLNLGGYRN